MKEQKSKKKIINNLLSKKFEGLSKIKGGNQIACFAKKYEFCMVVTCTCPPCCKS